MVSQLPQTDAPSKKRVSRVIVVSRLFSGLADSLSAEQWRPSGVPAITKLLEGLSTADNVALTTVFTVKDRATAAQFPGRRRFDLAPIGEVHILPYVRLPGEFGRFELILTELLQMLQCIALWIRIRPHSSYFTYANLPIAALFAGLRWSRVSLRFMGIMPYHRKLANGDGNRMIDRINRRFLRSRFDNVVCTEDGSDPSLLLPQLLRSAVPLTIKINGADAVAEPDNTNAFRDGELAPDDQPVILYLGRLERYKGCLEFVDAAVKVLTKSPECAQFVLVGDGTCRGEVEERIAASGHERSFLTIGAVAANEVSGYLARTHIYVSLNMHGNLSNANLEALSSGTCLVLPEEDRAQNIDTSTTRLLPPADMPRFDRHDIVASLSRVLMDLLADQERVARNRAASREIARQILRPWSARVREEIDLILGTETRPADHY